MDQLIRTRALELIEQGYSQLEAFTKARNDVIQDVTAEAGEPYHMVEPLQKDCKTTR